MKNLLSALAIALATLTVAGQATAARLDVTTDVPLIDLPFALAEYTESGGVGDLLMFDAEGLASGTTQAGDLFVTLAVTFDVADPAGTVTAGLFSVDDDGAFLDGDLVQAGFDGDVLQILFGNLTGNAAAAFGQFALLELAFVFPGVGVNPLAGLQDGTLYDVAGTISSATPIPLPAALPLLGAALGGLMVLRRRR